MPAYALLLWLAAASAVAAVLVLRLGWARKSRSVPINTAGWGLFVLAAVFGWAAAGAWGASVTALVAMGTACILLAIAAARAPKGKALASNRRVKMLLEAGEPRRIWRRVVTFLITVPLALLVSVGLSVVVRALADLAGASEADSIVLAFFSTPFLWAIILHMLLIQERRRGQWKVLLVSALPILPVVLTGFLA